MIENNLYKNLSTLFPTLIYREENFLPKSLMKKYKKLILNDPCENGGQGWIAKYEWAPGMVSREWTLTFEDERYATFFRLMYPE